MKTILIALILIGLIGLISLLLVKTCINKIKSNRFIIGSYDSYWIINFIIAILSFSLIFIGHIIFGLLGFIFHIIFQILLIHQVIQVVMAIILEIVLPQEVVQEGVVPGGVVAMEEEIVAAATVGEVTEAVGVINSYDYSIT